MVACGGRVLVEIDRVMMDIGYKDDDEIVG